jgi:nucleotide-binding universal stress UspA family protein
MAGVKHILVAIDLGEASKQALDYARTLAASFGASLHLLCVVQDPFSLPWAPEASRDALSTLLAQMQRDAQAHLETVIAPADRQRLSTRLVTRVGKPADQILTYARENTIDLIVLGRGGPSGLFAASAIGSVTEAVMRHASCPTLVVPAA